MKQFILVLFAILLFNSCGETEIEGETNPYKGVKIQKESNYRFLKEKFGEPIYEKSPSEVIITKFNRDGEIIELVYYDSSGKALDVNGDGWFGKEIRKYDEEGRLHTKQKNYVNGKQYKRWEYASTEFDSIKSVTLFDSNDLIQSKVEYLFDARKRRIETNFYDSKDSLQEKIKLHYIGLSTVPHKTITYNKNGEEVRVVQSKYTWFDSESLKVATKAELSYDDDYFDKNFYTYDYSGRETEYKSSFESQTSKYATESIFTTNYDSTGKRINSFHQSRFLPNQTKFKPGSKTIYEYEYYGE